ncbi:MAG: macro domain-containing protein [Erysipelotrichaceae bacterium]|jgi:O-acetyl-ADP-ribose deacetylase (regulator of RNase III)
MPLQILIGSIADQKTDIIVSRTDSNMAVVGNNSLAAVKKAGKKRIQHELEKNYSFRISDAVVTSGFDLCRYIIHAIEPDYIDDDNGSLLAATYNNVLNVAVELEAESISFPLICAGSNNYPKQLALDVAVKTIGKFIENHELDVKLVLLEEEKPGQIKYIELHRLINRSTGGILYRRPFSEKPVLALKKTFQEDAYKEIKLPQQTGCESSLFERYKLDDILDDMDISFSKTVLNLIDEKGYKDSDVYKRANLDRRLFSKLRSSDDYQPSKSTAIALAFALRLSVSQTDDLLLKAGYSLSRSNISDIIIKYCLDNEIYDVFEVNELLFHYNQRQLGSI